MKCEICSKELNTEDKRYKYCRECGSPKVRSQRDWKKNGLKRRITYYIRFLEKQGHKVTKGE